MACWDYPAPAGNTTSAKGSLVSLHNHSDSFPPSLADINSLAAKAKKGVVSLCLTFNHDGSFYWYTAPSKRIPISTFERYDVLGEKMPVAVILKLELKKPH